MEKSKKKNTAVTVHAETLPEKRSDQVDYLALAIQNGTSMDQLERLIALKERMDATNAEKQFNAAMAAFQKKCPVIKKTRSVKSKAGVQRYKFAPIESIITQVKDLIAEQGLFFDFTNEYPEKMLRVNCHVTHSAGHTKITSFEVPIGDEEYMTEVQKYGARQTFAKRYAFCNAFGITTADEDTDAGNTDEPKEQEKKKPGDPLIEGMTKAIEFTKNDEEVRVLYESNPKLKNTKWFVDAILKHRNTFPLPDEVVMEIATAGEPELEAIFNAYPSLQKLQKFKDAIGKRRGELNPEHKAPEMP